MTFFWVGMDDVGVCDIFSGWVWAEMIFFWVVVGGCDIFLGGCDIFVGGCGWV